MNSRCQDSQQLPAIDKSALPVAEAVHSKETVIPANTLSTEVQNTSLLSLLQPRGIELIQHRQPQPEDELFDPIAKYLSKNYSTLEKLHRQIKASISKKTNFSYKLYGKSQEEIQCCTQYCNNLYRATLLSRYHYDKRKKVIYGNVQHRGDIIQFLNGAWFERAVAAKVGEIFADKKVAYFINPHLRFKNGNRFELDLLFVVDGLLYWIECKTGNHYNDCLPKYCQHREALGVPKERAFLVGLGLSDRDAEKWTKLWSITVVNPAGLEARL